jgi:gliding motility-associated-like protein
MLEWQDHTSGSVFDVTQPGSYWVIAYEGNCSVKDTIEVSYLSALSLDLGPDTSLCNAQTITLDATLPGASYEWQDHSVSSTYNVTQAGSYWVEASISNCTVADTIVIDYETLSAPGLGVDTILCEGETLLLDATIPGASYLWQDNSTLSGIMVSNQGSYSVTISVGSCEVSDTILVDMHSIAQVDLGQDTTLCEGQTLLLTAVIPDGVYEWQNQSTQQDYLVTQPGVYFVNVSDGLCASMDTIQVAYLAVTSINLGKDTTLCANEILTLQPNAPGAQFLWQDNSTDPGFVIDNAGLYWVQVSIGNCLASDSIQVDIADPVIVEIGEDTTLCAGEKITLEVTTPNAVFEWNDHSSSGTYEVSQPGVYWVIAEVLGCGASDTITVDYIKLPQFVLGRDTSFCEGDTILLNAVLENATYSWQDNSTGSTFLVDQPGTYMVKVSSDHCSVSDTIQIEKLLPFVVDLGQDTTICDGALIILNPAITSNIDHQWQDGSTATTFEVQDAGDYWLKVKDACGVHSDTITISMDQCDCHVFIPNVFSPNGDNVHDEFIPVSSCGMTVYNFKVFDRSGGLLFETNEPGKGWNGISKSKRVQTGVYVYLLEYAFDDGKRRRTSGDVLVMW